MTNSIEALREISLTDTDGQRARLGNLWKEKGALFTFLRHYG